MEDCGGGRERAGDLQRARAGDDRVGQRKAASVQAQGGAIGDGEFARCTGAAAAGQGQHASLHVDGAGVVEHQRQRGGAATGLAVGAGVVEHHGIAAVPVAQDGVEDVGVDEGAEVVQRGRAGVEVVGVGARGAGPGAGAEEVDDPPTRQVLVGGAGDGQPGVEVDGACTEHRAVGPGGRTADVDRASAVQGGFVVGLAVGGCGECAVGHQGAAGHAQRARDGGCALRGQRATADQQIAGQHQVVFGHHRAAAGERPRNFQQAGAAQRQPRQRVGVA